MTYVAVALGGALGAMLRYGVSGWLHAAGGLVFPLGTLAVNVLGSFLIGLVLQASTERFLIPLHLRLLITTGFCGGLTTFSTFSYETLLMLEEQQWGGAAGNVVLNVALCLPAVYGGVLAARLL